MAETSGEWINPRVVAPLVGDELFTGGIDASVVEFWRWAFSDLQTNVVRGILAEFFVARALGDPSPVRRAFDDFDVTSAGGIRVEVKSAAYLQSWRQRRLSQIRFPAFEAGRGRTRRAVARRAHSAPTSTSSPSTPA